MTTGFVWPVALFAAASLACAGVLGEDALSTASSAERPTPNLPVAQARRTKATKKSVPAKFYKFFPDDQPQGAAKPHIQATIYPSKGGVTPVSRKMLVDLLADTGRTGRTWLIIVVYDQWCPHCRQVQPQVSKVADAFETEDHVKFVSINCRPDENEEACNRLEHITGCNDYPSFVVCGPSETHSPRPMDTLGESARLDWANATRDNWNDQEKLSAWRKEFRTFQRCSDRMNDTFTSNRKDPDLIARTLASIVTKTTGYEAPYFDDEIAPKPPEAPPSTEEADMIAAAGSPVGWPGDNAKNRPGVPAFVPGQRWKDGLVAFYNALFVRYSAERHAASAEVTHFAARVYPVHGRALLRLARALDEMGPQSDVHALFRPALAKSADEIGIAPAYRDGDWNITCFEATCAVWTFLHVSLAAAAARGVTARPLLHDGSAARVLPQKADAGLFLGQPAALDVEGEGDMEAPSQPNAEECLSFTWKFVKVFLSCAECRDHFLADYDDCKYERCNVGPEDWRGAALWLWRTHNAVSLRVAGEAAAEEGLSAPSVDRRWPMYQDCPRCWRYKPGLPSAIDNKTGDGDKDAKQGGATAAPNAKDALEVEDAGPEATILRIDEAYHLDEVFWHVVRTYVGHSRVSLEEEDVSKDEWQHIEAVRENDRRREAAAHSWMGNQHRGFVKYPPAPWVPHPRAGEAAASAKAPLSDGEQYALVLRQRILVATVAVSILTIVVCIFNHLVVRSNAGPRQPRLTKPVAMEEPRSREDVVQDESSGLAIPEAGEGRKSIEVSDDEAIDINPGAE